MTEDMTTEEFGDESIKIDGNDGFISPERVMITLSGCGFIKRIPLVVYRSQHRSGKSVMGMGRDADAVKLLAMADTNDNLFFFTNRGKVFRLKCHEIPADTSRTSKGVAIVKLLPITEGERVTAIVSVPDFKSDFYFIMATERGEVKKTEVTRFANIRSSGIIAMDIEEGDELIGVSLANQGDDVFLATEIGQSIRFPADSLRSSSRTSGGVRGIRLNNSDKVVSLIVALPDTFVLTVTLNGFGKLTPIDSYRQQHRGGVGIKTLKVTDKTGKVASAKLVYQNQRLMIMSSSGMVICTPIKEGSHGIPVRSRGTQAVRLMRIDEGDQMVSLVAFN